MLRLCLLQHLYGGRLNSQPQVDQFPTDKLFTGQRLDDTGLYYYNARYYDPEIGRFISPDSIVPNPANPQSLNRYSYCLNNPLKYIDPSGNTVHIADGGLQSWIDFCQSNSDAALALGRSDTMFYWGTGKSRDRLAIAYFLATWANPALSTEKPIMFFGSQDGGAVTLGGSTPFQRTGLFILDAGQSMVNILSSRVNVVMVSPDYRAGDIRSLAAIIGHELSHSKEGYFSDSILEETIAYGIQYGIEDALNIGNPNSFQAQCAGYGLNPTRKQLEGVKASLGNSSTPTGRMYKSLPLYPTNNWNTLLGMVNALITKPDP